MFNYANWIASLYQRESILQANSPTDISKDYTDIYLYMKDRIKNEPDGHSELIKGKAGNSCRALYLDRSNVVMLVYMNDKKKDIPPYPVLIDKDFYFNVVKKEGTSLYLHLSCGDTEYRPAIRHDGIQERLHCAILPTDLSVDHITCNPHIAVRSCLRVATPKQNRANHKMLSQFHQNKDGSYNLKMTITTDDETIRHIANDGFKVKLNKSGSYEIQKTFINRQRTYEAINYYEKLALGDFRYNPILACENRVEFIIYCEYLMFGMSRKDFINCKLISLQQTKPKEFCWSYGIPYSLPPAV